MGVFKLPSLNHKSVTENVALTQEEERKRREEAERKRREEEERLAKAEAERQRKEAERKAKEEAERKAKEEAERQRKEAARKAKEEAARKAKEEAARKAKAEAERRAKQDRAALDNIKSWMPNFDIFGLGSAEKDTIYKFLEECSKKEGNKVEISLRTFAKAAKIIAKNKRYIY